jgi:hypothetical protein
MVHRPLRKSDVAECLSLRPDRRGIGSLTPVLALQIRERLFASPAFHSTVVCELTRVSDGPILGFGCSVLVSPELIRNEESNIRPGLNTRVLQPLDTCPGVLMSDAQICAVNGAEGVGIVVLCAEVRPECAAAADTTFDPAP